MDDRHNEAVFVPILIVDDDEVVGQVLGRILTRQGHTIWRAGSAGQALEMAREHQPRLALVDLCLPDGDGISLTRDLRSEHPELEVILMTAFPLRLQEQQELQDNFARVLVKPLDLAELRQAVSSTLAFCE